MEKSLLLASKASDSLIQVQLHPLVILTISDYTTRHVSRQLDGPIIGAIIGAQSGRDVTMEYAFECKLTKDKKDSVILDDAWFNARLQQYRDVHKATSLDLTGWFTLVPTSGPEPHLLPIHSQLLTYNESILLLGFHTQSLVEADTSSSAGRLPLTIYETSYETAGQGGEGEDKTMHDTNTNQSLSTLRFCQVPYTIETGEAEMIAVDYVARGGANATAADDTTPAPTNTTVADNKQTTNGFTDATLPDADSDVISATPLSAEDDDMIATLTAKANAIRMLRQRLGLMRAYITSLPPCYLNTSPSASANEPQHMSPDTQISHPVLRSIASLLARLPLLSLVPANDTITPSAPDSTHEKAAASADSALVGLLGAMAGTLRGATDVGRKAGLIESARLTNVALSNVGSTKPIGFGGLDSPGGGRETAFG